MELLQRFERCIKERKSIKKEFQWIGLPPKLLREPLRNLDEETEFAGIMNWIINKMPQKESIKIRFKAANHVYQVEQLISLTDKWQDFILYDWNEETNYDKLTSEDIKEAATRADYRNHTKKTGWGITEDECDNEVTTITAENLELINDFLEMEGL